MLSSNIATWNESSKCRKGFLLIRLLTVVTLIVGAILLYVTNRSVGTPAYIIQLVGDTVYNVYIVISIVSGILLLVKNQTLDYFFCATSPILLYISFTWLNVLFNNASMQGAFYYGILYVLFFAVYYCFS